MSVPIMSVEIDAKGRIVSLKGEEFLTLHKIDPAQYINKNLDTLPKTPVTAVLRNVTSLLRERDEPIRLTTQIDGSTALRTIEAVAVPVHSAEVPAQVVLCDTTFERRTAEESWRQEKYNSLSTLARGVAHSINNALVGIIGHAALAEQSLPPYHAARFNIEQLLKAADQTTELAAQLMIYAGNHDPSMRRIQPALILKENLPLFQAALSHNVKLHIAELSEEAPPVMADIKILQQGLISALAALASAVPNETPGEITVQLSPQTVLDKPEELLTLAGKITPGQYTAIRLSLPGGHVKASDLRQWFDPFQHNRTASSLIGPAALLAAARLHKGGLNAYIDSSKTLHLTLLLPAVRVTEEQQQTVEPRLEFKPEGLALIIDDEQAVRDVAKEMLSKLGFEVLTAETGELGLDLATKNIEKLTLVLLDLHMPSLGGAETFRGLRLIQPNLRVLISSGYSKSEAMQHFPDSEGTAFLQKPYRIPELEAAVRDLFTRPM